MNLIKYFFISLFILFASSCKKDPKMEDDLPATLTNGMLVLNEGLFQLNNASLSWVNFSDGTVDNEFFTKKTGRFLGDTGNDLKRYGGKIYIVVNVSSTIEILDANTGESIKQVVMNNGSVGKQPRSIDFHQGRAYISCFDGFVDVLDTASLEITQRIPVGSNPDNLTISGNHLFVSNTGGLNSPVMDSTVSVIDLNTQAEIKKIVVGVNPGSIQAAEGGNVYVVTRGKYGSVPARMVRISSTTLTRDQVYGFGPTHIAKFGNQLLLTTMSSGSESQKIALFDPASNEVVNANFMGVNQVHTLYNVQYIPSQNKIYVMDAKAYTNTGYVHIYSASGTLLTSYHVGLNPNSILIL